MGQKMAVPVLNQRFCSCSATISRRSIFLRTGKDGTMIWQRWAEPNIAMGFVEQQQIRGLKRNRKRPLSRVEKAERKARREARLAEKHRFSYMEKVMMRSLKMVASPSLQFPGRYDPDAEAQKSEIPQCSIYFREDYQTKFFSVSEALAQHRLLQMPEIYGNKDASLKLRIELNMSTERKSKMVSDSNELVVIPHPFAHKEKRAILAFVEGKILQDEAVMAGADIAVGRDMIKKILKGQFMIDDYDFCVAHTNMIGEIPTLRGILRHRFPTKINGALGDDLPQIIKNFLQGVKIIIKGDHIHSHWGLSEPFIGRLNMPDEHIEANIAAIIGALCRHRNPALGPFINRAVMMTIPGKAFPAIDVTKWLPEATEAQKNIVEKRTKKKKKKKVSDELEENAIYVEDDEENDEAIPDAEVDGDVKRGVPTRLRILRDPRVDDPLVAIM